MSRAALPVVFVVASCLGVLVGCSSGPPAPSGPPSGWEAADGRWWQAGVDTATAFRDLEDLRSMELYEQEVFAANAAIARQSGLEREQFLLSVKQTLLPIFRNEPEIVDSLFDKYVVPKLADADLSDPSTEAAAFKRTGYNTLRNHFREPRTALKLGEDVPVIYPDSLRRQGVTGKVTMQVRLDEEGEPQAIELLEGVHPTLDAFAMEATTQMRWRPAYLMRNGRWKPVSSWVRFSITFRDA